MAESEVETVNRQTFQVTYDGIAVSGEASTSTHEMDVQSLGPALVAFGRLIKEANAQINGKKSTVKVLVQSDFEHKCFNITFDVVQSVLNQMASFLTGEQVKNAKEILEDLGIILGTPSLGLFGYLKWKNNREVTDVRDSDAKGIIIVQLGDGNTTNVNRNTIELSRNVKIRNFIEGTLKPLGVDGVDTINFRDGHGTSTYNRDDVTKIVTSFDIPRDEQLGSDLEDGDEVIAFLRVYDLAFDEKASSAKFSYEGRHITVDISDTSIGSDTVRRRSISIDDLYKVRMSITPHATPSGKETVKYKIMEVINFTPARQQTSLF